MLRIKRGDVHLMGTLFERYGQRMFTYFLRNTGSRADSEDLLQLLFERMLRYRETYRAEAKFTTWMYQVASNLRADYYKDRNKEVDKMKAFKMERDDPPKSRMSELTDETSIKQDILKRALSQLPDDQREVLVLGKYEGLRYKEVGRILGCSEGAVKVRIYRAMNELRKICREIAEELNYDL